jgi:hypothetical protein
MSLQAIQSANRDIEKAPPGPFQDCRDVVHLSFYFDGTGNNRFADDAAQKWSNVARLFFAARDDKSNGIYRIYLAGVGTRYNASRNWAERFDSWFEDKTLGNAGGFGGDRRLDGGEGQMSDALEKVLLANARLEGGKAKKIADKNENEGFAKLSEALGNHRLIKAINFSVFGFSRGAALARAFTNRVSEQMQWAGASQYKYHGVDARINFLGVFDTVASFGLPGTNWGGWKSKDLTIPPHVESCHHYAAGHELRFSFPVDLVRDRGLYHGNKLEKVYPGVHSDVGGGYESGKQGRTDLLSRVPLADMQVAAIDHGARINSVAVLRKTNAPIAKLLAVDDATLKDYQAYMTATGGQAGTVEARMRRHMEHYFAYRGTQYRKKAGTAGDNAERVTRLREELKVARASEAKASSASWNTYNPLSSTFGRSNTVKANKTETAWENRIVGLEVELAAAERDASRLAASDEGIAVQARALEHAIKTGNPFMATEDQLIVVIQKHTWMLDAWKRTADSALCAFFDRYVHDSRTDFLGGKEPFVYFRNRGVHEQARPSVGANGSW